MLQMIAPEENELLMDTMRNGVDAQDGPKVGMFWYNPARNVLVGVHSAFASELPFNNKGRKTLRVLHHTAWPGVRKAAKAIGSADRIWDEEDYTQVPRGCVFQIEVPGSDEAHFDILVGSWADEYPQAMPLIVEEFNLANAKFQFVHSEHWNIGRGTSEIFI